ncbi:CCA tRNA nucleotidyltransferase, mitochondrial [[Candida] jaroonii]|uniref:CCA tRNA nucleotidyltransferase, mitochondrial n=1 Tax=[Candida] jaroonii TaxID=467808 RepID=A0ACA9YDJ1_9ASCO|nr:CCA tRNA nucleotidyltransferase, mitochondrial [[Candida] jaroonii]
MVPRVINTTIKLNETESQIRDLLMEFCDYHNQKNESSQLVLRITGGWVRDKLLGDESNDLDIAINTLSGEDFVTKLTDYLNENHPNLSLKAIHTIKKNPAKSKHLETCTAKIYGLDIDFVNLRSEKYTVDSRIPIIEYGTAEEDALRRDATLNALFYNLNEKKIEDFTGKGINDLKEGILRTPLTPLQTFLDDPLRVLRLIRFASRYNFTIDNNTLNAMKNSEIKSSLLHKISRERIGVELEKILKSNNPEYGLKLLNYVSISESVFNLDTVKQEIMKLDNSINFQYENLLSPKISTSTTIFPTLRNIVKSSNLSMSKIFSNVSPKVFWLSIILSPFQTFPIENAQPKILNDYYVPRFVVREGLRFGKNDYDQISKVLMELSRSKEILLKVLNDDIKRSQFGLYLREFGDFVDVNLAVNCFDDILTELNLQFPVEQPTPDEDLITNSNMIQTVESNIQKYNTICDKIHQFDLSEVNKLKPIIDGKTISKSLNKKPGPWIAQITQEVLIWQLDNPHGTQEECLEFIKTLI